MNELRLKYHRDTGIRIHEYYFPNNVVEYVEWLEEQLAECEAVGKINKQINGKNKTFYTDGPIFYSPDK